MSISKVVKLVGQPFDFDQHTLIFVHIPKCGGTSLHITLSGVFGDKYRHLRGKKEDLTDIETMQGIGGHVNYGANPLHKRRSGLVYITVIRPPVQRIISFYRHVMDHPHHHLRKQMPAIHKRTPEGFIRGLRKRQNYEISNLQSKMLTGVDNPSSQEVIDHVEANYSIVGLLEQPATYLEPLQDMFPGKPVEGKTLNVSKPRDLSDTDTDEFVELVRRTNDVDLEVYEHFAKKNAQHSVTV